MSKDIWISDILAGKYDGSEVEVKGWIYRSRGSNKIRFIVVRDSTGNIQCVAKRDVLGDVFFDELKSSLIESSVILKGIVQSTDREHGHELQVLSGEIIGPVNPERPFPITESAMAEADGGETEFIYQQKRFKAEKGTVLIWPAGYTHMHRGNPPLSNKYIATGWYQGDGGSIYENILQMKKG